MHSAYSVCGGAQILILRNNNNNNNNNNNANICIARLKQNSSGALMAQTNTVSVFAFCPNDNSDCEWSRRLAGTMFIVLSS